ncbi:MAG: helix-turn-helix transcriptional regulator [Parachlamydia sp.]|nr:helix-turn-helix transcriptional regulator [Parachlamydia sp.]
MSAHMKARRTDSKLYEVIVISPQAEKVIYNVNLSHMREVEKLLKKYEAEDEPVEWEILAKERIEKYKKAGLVLRGMRYRENISQKELAMRSKVSQNEISKIENGKRTVGVKVAKRLANALRIDYRILTES